MNYRDLEISLDPGASKRSTLGGIAGVRSAGR